MNRIGDRTIADLWADRVTLFQDKPFLVADSGDGTISRWNYSEFDESINRSAQALQERFDIQKGDKVMIHLPNSPEHLRLWFAVMKLGAVAVHSNLDHTAREIRLVSKRSDSTVIITTAEYIDSVMSAVKGVPIDPIVLSDKSTYDWNVPSLVYSKYPRASPDVNCSASDSAQILFTSGTTAEPKGVVHSHENLLRRCERYSMHLSMRPEDRYLTALPVYHANGQGTVLSMLAVGGTVILLEQYDTKQFMQKVRQHDATLTALIGTQLKALLGTPEQTTDTMHELREILFAINVSKKSKRAFERRFDVTITNVYGLTEAYSLVAMAPLYDERRYPSVGRPLFDRDVFVVDQQGKPQDTGNVGEIAVDGERGVDIFVEYYGQPEATRAAFTEDGLLLTGDLGRFDDDGYLYFVDRRKNIIETRGENVSEAEVEGVLEQHPEVQEAVVIGIEHEVYGEAVKAFLIPGSDSLSIEDISAFAGEHLAEFKIPEAVEFTPDVPRTGVGKADKKHLRDQAEIEANDDS